jgi:thioredoxin reductase
VRAARLVLATGVRDDLPPIDGLAERWGKSVFHCPYCHGYELSEGRIGVLASGPLSVHQAQMLPHWGQVTLFTNGVCPLDDAQRADLQARGVEVDETPVRRLVNVATVVLEDGRQEIMTGLFTYGRLHMTSPIAEQLGCAFEQGPLGPFIRTDDSRQTTVPAVFAAGDAMRAASTVALSVADGAMAGVGAHRSLLFGVTPFAAPMMPAVASSAPAGTRK